MFADMDLFATFNINADMFSSFITKVRLRQAPMPQSNTFIIAFFAVEGSGG